MYVLCMYTYTTKNKRDVNKLKNKQFLQASGS